MLTDMYIISIVFRSPYIFPERIQQRISGALPRAKALSQVLFPAVLGGVPQGSGGALGPEYDGVESGRRVLQALHQGQGGCLWIDLGG